MDKSSARQRLRELIQPEDIILVRGVGFEDLLMSVYYSPYWTHAAIYVGGETVVAENGERRNFLAPYGVLECEEFCVMRVNAHFYVRVNAALFALSQVGKPCN